MHDQISVSVFRRTGRKFWYAQYRDPATNNKVVQSTGKVKKRDADRFAAKWEKELREGNAHRAGKITWQDFRDRYADEVLPALKDKTGERVISIFNVFERKMKPHRLEHVTPDMLSRYSRRTSQRWSCGHNDSRPLGAPSSGAGLGCGD